MRRADRPGPTARKRNDKTGFALVIVIWGLGVITLLIVAFMTTARLRLQAAFNIAGATQARLVADGAANAAILSLLSERNLAAAPDQARVHDGAPQFCVMDVAVVAVVIEDEGGKVDLNSATPELLTAMLAGLGAAPSDAAAIAKAIVAFRTTPPTNEISTKDTSYEASGRTFGPKRAPFETVLELDQVIGVEKELFHAVLPFVTIHSRAPGVDPAAASPALFAALAGFSLGEVRALAQTPFPNRLNRKDPRFPSVFKQSGERVAFLVHAEAVLPAGQMSVSETLVDLNQSGAAPFAIREVRNGATRYGADLRAMLLGGAPRLPNC